jgi:hypothetical protein
VEESAVDDTGVWAGALLCAAQPASSAMTIVAEHSRVTPSRTSKAYAVGERVQSDPPPGSGWS